MPPALAFIDLQPEVFGSSAGGQLTVCAAKECTAAELSSVSGNGTARADPFGPPKGCPGNCGGSGLCDTGTGTCECYAGFAGPICAPL